VEALVDVIEFHGAVDHDELLSIVRGRPAANALVPPAQHAAGV